MKSENEVENLTFFSYLLHSNYLSSKNYMIIVIQYSIKLLALVLDKSILGKINIR